MSAGEDRLGDDELQTAVRELRVHLSRLETMAAAGTHLRGGPHHRHDDAGEARWPVLLAVVVAIGLQTALPDRLTFGPRYLLPALEAALLIGIFAANPRRIGRGARDLRALTIALIAVSSLANGWSSVLLIDHLVNGTAGKGAAPLLASGASIYLTNVIVFALWYWETDRGGPRARTLGTDTPPDFLWPQISQPDAAPPGWRPTFLDYLFTSYTNATAFSPTDVLPLSHRAKMLMGLQSAIALATLALVVARAVNILN